MPRPDKVQAVAEIRDRLEASDAVFLTEYRGIPVKAMGDLRRRLRTAGAEYRVVKMTLARRAVGDLGIEGMDEYLLGPTALAFADDDPVAVAKALSDYARENESLVIKLGLLAGKVLSPEQVRKLAEIEPREVLLAKIAGAAKAPLQALAGLLSSFTRDAASVMGQLLEKKEALDGAASTEAASIAADDEAPAEAEADAEAAEAEATEAAEAADEAEAAEAEAADEAPDENAPDADENDAGEAPDEESGAAAEEE